MTKQRIISLSMFSVLQAVTLYHLLHIGALMQGSIFFYSPFTMMYWSLFYCVEVMVFTLCLFHFFKDSRSLWSTRTQSALAASALILVSSQYLGSLENEKQFQYRLSLQARTQEVLQQRFVRPPLRGEALSQDAHQIYWQQLGAKQQPEQWKLSYEQRGRLIKHVSHHEQLLRTVIQNPEFAQKHIEQVNLASRATQSHEVPYAVASLDVDGLLPDYIALQSHGALMANQALTKMSSHPTGGFNLLLDTVRFGQDIAHTGPYIQAMVGLDIANVAVNTYALQQAALYEPQVDTSHLLRQWENLLTVHRGITQASFQSDILTIEKTLYDSRIWQSEVLADEIYGEPAKMTAGLLKVLNYLPAQRQAYIKYTHRLIQKSFSSTASETEKKQVGENLLSVYFTIEPLKDLDREKDSYRRLLTAYAQTALADYYRRYQRYPESLEELDNLSEKKWFADQGLTYTLEDGAYQLKIRVSDGEKLYPGPVQRSQTSA